ncbi:MAG: chloride channel protein [Zoogloeaceae bacterium]|nr:chloride channel protein [Zoogloeaceae bacterium]
MPWLSFRRWRRRFFLVGAALLAGFIAIVFAVGAEVAIHAHAQIVEWSPWLTLVVAPGGFALMAWIARRWFPSTQGSGIPQAIAASVSDDGQFRQRLLSLRIALAKVVLTLGGLLAGASIGREGPSVQIGAAVLHSLASRHHGRIAPPRDLIIAGGAAGIAAAFNTPLGGIMFAIEEMSRYRVFRANSTTLAAVIFSGLMSLAILGNYTYFGRSAASLGWPSGILPVLITGSVGGLAGGLFARLLISVSRGLPGRLGALAREHPIRLAAACGLATALLGLVTGGATYGTGYAESKAALEATADLPGYYGIAKAMAVLLAFVSGIPGGIFAPSLAVGAGLGANIAALLPDEQSAAILLLGMVAFLSGITQAPITSFVIVMEMTANHQMLLPLMAASVVSVTISRSVTPTPLYDAMAQGLLRRQPRSPETTNASALPPARPDEADK